MAEKISFIIPCYRSEHTILDVVQELRTMMENLNTYDFEIVLVNDASPDHVWNVIQKLCICCDGWFCKCIRGLYICIG